MALYDDTEITLADIPGLIEGAHSGVGLGIKFLKHIERCKTLLHLIDVTEKNLVTSYKQVRNELGKYSKNLLKRIYLSSLVLKYGETILFFKVCYKFCLLPVCV